MPDPVLRYRSGFPSTSPNLQNDVKRLQRALLKAGYEVDVDGRFGQGTLKAVKAFQRAQGLKVDGIVGGVADSAAGTQPGKVGVDCVVTLSADNS